MQISIIQEHCVDSVNSPRPAFRSGIYSATIELPLNPKSAGFFCNT